MNKGTEEFQFKMQIKKNTNKLVSCVYIYLQLCPSDLWLIVSTKHFPSDTSITFNAYYFLYIV